MRDRISGFRAAFVTSAVVVTIAAALLASPSGASPATGPSTGTVVATAPSPNGQVLVAGSGTHQGYALYYITSDAPPKFGCTTTVVVIAPGTTYHCTGPESDQQADWPALTTVGRPVAGPGVRQSLLGSVKRADLQANQVTYSGHPLYLFDPAPSQFTGGDLVQAMVPPDHGVWYLVSPKRGLPAPHIATLMTVTLPGGRKVLGGQMVVSMNTPPAPETFPVYSYSPDRSGRSACQSACAAAFPPLLTSGQPQVAPNSGLDPRRVGVVVRADGTRQVTYNGKPLYLDGDEKFDGSNAATPFSGSGDGARPPVGAAGVFLLVAVTG